MITNDRIRISKSYQGTISDIVYDVMTRELGVTKKPVTITKTTDIHHFVVPNLRPVDFLLSLFEHDIYHSYHSIIIRPFFHYSIIKC